MAFLRPLVPILVLALAIRVPAEPAPDAGPDLHVQNDAGSAVLAGVDLVPPEPLSAFKLAGSHRDAARVTIVSDDRTGQGNALRADTLLATAEPYDCQLTLPTAAAVTKGDVIAASFWIRGAGPDGAPASVGFVFEAANPPYQRFMSALVPAGTQWMRIDLPFRALGSYGPGEAVTRLRLGYAIQTVEISGFSLSDLGPNANLSALPCMKFTYEGRDPDALWRAVALDRIEKVRKAGLTVRVVDANGQPVPGASVEVKETRSAFRFGAAIDGKDLLADTPAGQKYREMVATLFDRVTLENDLKWARWQADPSIALKASGWLAQNGVELRGHNLIWPGFPKMPPAMALLKDQPDKLSQAIDDHITQEATAMRGRVVEWDVVNEPYSSHDALDLCGPDAMDRWFTLAHQADPGARLMTNDFGILSAGGRDAPHQQNYEDHIKKLLADGAPLGGIGLQGHFDSDLTPPTKILAILDRFARFGKPIEITEFDLNVADEGLQADFTRDFLIAAFSHPAVNAFVMWNFWEGHESPPCTGLWHRDWTPKPNGQVWLDLVKKAWRTDDTLQTDATGTCATRAFLGDYEITASLGARTATATSTLVQPGGQVTVTLP